MLKKIAKKVAKTAVPALRRGPSLGGEWLTLQKYRLSARAKSPEGRSGNVALVGCGVMGAYACRSISLLGGWEVSAVCDLDEAKATGLRDRAAPRAHIFTSFEEMIRSAEFDLLVVATTAPSHAVLVSTALDLGARNILVEKPVSASLADADALIQKATSLGATVQVDHSRRWGYSVRGLRRLVQSGVIGNPAGAHFAYGRAGMAMIGTHLFDLSRFLFEAEFTRVSAKLDSGHEPNWRGSQFRDPSGRCDTEMEGGIRVSVDLSAKLGYQQRYLTIFGDEGRIEVDETHKTLTMIAAGGRRWESAYDWELQRLAALAEAILDTSKGNVKQGCSLADGRAALECCVGCHVSDRNGGGWISLPLTGEVRSEVFPFA